MAYLARSIRRGGYPEFESWEHHVKLVKKYMVELMVRAGIPRSEAEVYASTIAYLHDLGKCSLEFRIYIYESGWGRKAVWVDHKTAGPIYASQQAGMLGKLLAYSMHGHHGSLPDHDVLMDALSRQDLLDMVDIPKLVISLKMPKCLPKGLSQSSEISLSTLVRILQSILVDADRLAAEQVSSEFKHKMRFGRKFMPLDKMAEKFKKHAKKIAALASASKAVIEVRQEVAKASSDASHLSGIHSLQAPTGSGKTLASLAEFALPHAVKHGKRRVIVVMPFINITEQTSSEVRKAVGEENFIEHHSNIEHNDSDKLFVENWDAPLILTTFAQFFETCYGSKSSRTRKMHNIANSVVVIDECHMLPMKHIKPCVEMIRELHGNWGVTFLLMSATMPPYSPIVRRGVEVFSGLSVNEIIDDPKGMASKISNRATVHLPRGTSESTLQDIANKARGLETTLVVLNLREHAAIVYDELKGEGVYFLSGMMCSAHRSVVIRKIKTRLASGLPTKVIATSVISCGEDISFPAVVTAMSSIAELLQTSGRVNRCGTGQGDMFVYYVRGWSPSALKGIQITRSMLARGLQIFDLEAVSEFYRRMFMEQDDSVLPILRDNSNMAFNFESAAKKFKIIEETVSIVVDYDNAMSIFSGHPGWERQRLLQRYVVSVYPNKAKELFAAGIIEENDGVWVQCCPGAYSDTGLWMGFANQKLPLIAV